MKQLKHPLFYLQWILIILSLIGFVLALTQAFNLTLDISSKGFQTFLSFFDPYKVLFGATFIVIATNQAIERLGLMSEANTNAFKASNRTLWMQTVKEFFSEVREQDPYICKEISRNLLNIHDYLFQKDYKFEKQEDKRIF